MSPTAPVVDALHDLALGVLVAVAEAGDDGLVLLLGLAAGVDDRLHAGGVDGHGLLAEDVLAGLDGRLDVQRPEVRRRGQEHHVDVAVEDLLVGVEADEAVVGLHVDLGADLARRRAGWLRLVCRWSSKTSPRATSLTLGSACRACAAAPVPRPPQPMRPMRERVGAAGVDERHGTEGDGAGRGDGQELAARGAGRGERKSGASREGLLGGGGGNSGENVYIPRRRPLFHHEPRRRCESARVPPAPSVPGRVRPNRKARTKIRRSLAGARRTTRHTYGSRPSLR